KYSNSNFKPISFASEKNKNIESVQFTIRTEGISIEKKENIVKEEKKEDNPWKMFLNIFKKQSN
ncbi:hypothetical protein, partial [Romboutsia sp.]|uniref:hypothetical protein n=1 Tax=Romboutsia sp. TaxID=1965302 RepID=UPI003F38D15F